MGLLEPYKPPLARRSRAITPQVRKCRCRSRRRANRARLSTLTGGVGWAFKHNGLALLVKDEEGSGKEEGGEYLLLLLKA